MLTAIDWGAVWDWIVQPAVIVPVVIALVGGAYKIGTRHVDQRGRNAEKMAAEEATRQHAEDRLDETHVSFGRWACVPHGSGTSRPSKPSVTIEVYDAGVWVHGVHLRWRYRTDAKDEWRLEQAACAPFDPGVDFPVSVPMGETIGLTWPGSPLPKQQAIEWNLDVEWGISRTGATRVTHVGEGSTSWQEIAG